MKEKHKQTLDKIKQTAKKVWHFLAHEDSWASFFVDAILIILIAKFIIFPGIGFALHTEYPVVAVISHSMDHHGQDFDSWWIQNKDQYEDYEITKAEFEEFYKQDGFKKGDLFVVVGKPTEELNVGDVIVYNSGRGGNPIIHRIVSKTEVDGEIIFETKGDANLGQLDFEKNIKIDRIYGKAVFWAPKIGWVKVAFIDLLSAIKR
jgi:hypothetical protein